MRTIFTLLAVAFVALPIVSSAQPERHEASRSAAFHERGAADPAGHVLALRDELDLASEQVARLEEIQTGFQTIAEPLLEQLRTALPERSLSDQPRERRAERAPRGGDARARMEELRPLMQQLRELRAQAYKEVQAVLNDEQQARLDALRAERRQATREQRRARH